MLECIKFGDCKINTIQIEDEWFVSVHPFSIALGMSSDTLKGIVRNRLPQQYKFSRKEIIIDDSYDGSKFTTISGVCRVILGSTDPDRHNVIDFLVFRIRLEKHKKTSHVALDDSIPTAEHYREHIYFVFKLGVLTLLGKKRIAYEYACI